MCPAVRQLSIDEQKIMYDKNHILGILLTTLLWLLNLYYTLVLYPF